MNYILDKQGLTNNELKIIAIVAMTMDHIAFGFMDPNTIKYQLFRMVGRFTIVIMCYMIAEGYKHTHSIKKYLTRLFMFAIVSHVPFIFFHTGKISFLFEDNGFQTSVIWSLFLGLLSLCIWNNNKLKKVYKIILLIFMCILAMPGDWSIFAVLLIWGFGVFYEKRKMQMIFLGVFALYIGLLSVSVADQWYKTLYNFGLFLTIPILMKYKGCLGNSKHLKWIFYVYYPMHMIILGIIRYM